MKKQIMVTFFLLMISVGLLYYIANPPMEANSQKEINKIEEKRIISGEADINVETIEEKKAPLSNEIIETKKIIVIDAGHQQHYNPEKEPIGPDSTTLKMKVSGGTAGRFTKIPEYVLTLQLAEKLKFELENRNYEVIMTRETHEVNISNSERAQIANEAGADAFIRIHADGSENQYVSGATTICQTKNNPYNSQYYESSKRLSTCVLDNLVEATGCKRRLVWETDTMSGINWCQVPVTIVEVGFMTNKIEDELMAREDYQIKIITGIADGIDKFFTEEHNEIETEQ